MTSAEAGFVRLERDAHDRRRLVVQLGATRGLRDGAPAEAGRSGKEIRELE